MRLPSLLIRPTNHEKQPTFRYAAYLDDGAERFNRINVDDFYYMEKLGEGAFGKVVSHELSLARTNLIPWKGLSPSWKGLSPCDFGCCMAQSRRQCQVLGFYIIFL